MTPIECEEHYEETGLTEYEATSPDGNMIFGEIVCFPWGQVFRSEEAETMGLDIDELCWRSYL